MITLILISIAAVLNAGMDLMIIRRFRLDGMFWDPHKSWIKKWKSIVRPYEYWYYLGLYKPTYQERFPYSSTFLVFLTDGWHLFKSLFLVCFVLAIVYYEPILGFWDPVLFYLAYTTVFTYFYQYILKR